MNGEVLFLVLLELTGAGVALAAGLRPALACGLGLPLGLALWTLFAGLVTSLGVPPHAAVTLAPVFGAVAALLLAGRPVVLVLAALAVAGLAAAALRLGIASVPPLGHDALLAAQLPIDAWAELDPAARFLAIVHGGVRALGAPFAVALGPLAGAATVFLVAAGCARRPAAALLVALALATTPLFLRAATAIDLPVTGALFLTAFAVVHARGVEQGSVRLLPIECLLLTGLAIHAAPYSWIAALLLPLAYRADPRPPARIAAWLGVQAAVVAWWYLAALVTAPDRALLALPALAPLAGTAIWLATRQTPVWRAAAGAGLLLGLAALAGSLPGAGDALVLFLPLLALTIGARAAGRRRLAPASPAAAPALPRAAAWLVAGALAIAFLTNLAEQARQHRAAAPGTRLLDPGPTTRIDRWTDLHAWIKQHTPGVTAVIPARLAPQVVLFRYFAGVDVVTADPPPTLPATAAFDLVFQADAYRTLHFKRTRTREPVVAIARPRARRYVLAESLLGVLIWLPEDLYLAAGGEPLR